MNEGMKESCCLLEWVHRSVSDLVFQSFGRFFDLINDLIAVYWLTVHIKLSGITRAPERHKNVRSLLSIKVNNCNLLLLQIVYVVEASWLGDHFQ